MIKLATIGTSWITEKFISAAKATGCMELCAIYSRDKQKGFAFAQKHGAKLCFDDTLLMAQSDKIDAVYIASPNAFHFEQALLFINHKKHVLCEKPVTLNPLQARYLFEQAQKNGVVFMEAMMSSYVPQLKLLNEAVKSIGNVCMAKFDFSQLSSKYPLYLSGQNPNIFNPLFATGCLMDLGVYCVYVALNLFGPPNELTAKAVKMPNGIDASGSAFLSYHDKLVVLTYSKVGQSVTPCEIIGDKGTVTINGISSLKEITVVYNDGTKQVIHNNPVENAMVYEAQAFCNFITDFDAYESEYNYNKMLTISVSQMLKQIRNEIDLVFPAEQ